jgi:RNA polymerase sigma factor (sigma-70 family)
MNSHFVDSIENQKKVKNNTSTPCLADSGAYIIGVRGNTTSSGANYMMSAIATLAATVQILTRDEQIDHANAFQKTGDKRAMDALIRSNIPLAIKIAKKNVRNSVDIDDLLMEAVTGIMRAAESFDPTCGASFTTYARQWMTAKCQQYVQENCGTIRVGSRVARKLYASLPRLRRQFGADVDNATIAKELGLEAADVEKALALLGKRAASLNAPLNSEGATVANIVADGKILQDERMARTEQSRNIGEVLNVFHETLKNDRDVKIFTHRVASDVYENDKLTTVELAKEFNVSKQRIAQIEKGMTQKLRKALQPVAVN